MDSTLDVSSGDDMLSVSPLVQVWNNYKINLIKKGSKYEVGVWQIR